MVTNSIPPKTERCQTLASETDVAEDGSLYPIIEYWSEEENPIIAIRIDSIFQIARIRFPEEYGLPFIYVLKNK